MGRLDGRVAIVTGAARGQGEAEARLFAVEGARVVLGDVLDAEGRAVADSLGEAAIYAHLDVTSESDWAAVVEPRQGLPEDIARLALFLCSDDASYSTGSEFIADGGLLATP